MTLKSLAIANLDEDDIDEMKEECLKIHGCSDDDIGL